MAETDTLPEPSSAMPAWQDVAEQFQAAYPGLPPDYIQKRYEQHRELALARARSAATQDSFGDVTARHSLPVLSSLQGYVQNRDYGQSLQRFQEGKPQRQDYQVIADQERVQQQEAERNQTLLGKLGTAALGAPALLGEAALGGAVMKGLGAAGSLAGKSAQVVVPVWTARLAGQTAMVPSLYLKQFTDSNIAAGRDPVDLRGLPAAFGVAMVQNAILGQLSNQPWLLQGAGVGTGAARLGLKGAIGVGEQAIADVGTGLIQDQLRKVMPEWTARETHYGTIGDLLDGKRGEALRDATVQAITFAAFGMFHEAQHGTPHGQKVDRALTAEAADVLASYQQRLEKLAKRGLSPDAAGRNVTAGVEALAQALEKNPDLNREGARRAAAAMPAGLAKEFAQDLAEAFPKVTPPRNQELPPQGPHPGTEGPLPSFAQETQGRRYLKEIKESARKQADQREPPAQPGKPEQLETPITQKEIQREQNRRRFRGLRPATPEEIAAAFILHPEPRHVERARQLMAQSGPSAEPQPQTAANAPQTAAATPEPQTAPPAAPQPQTGQSSAQPTPAAPRAQPEPAQAGPAPQPATTAERAAAAEQAWQNAREKVRQLKAQLATLNKNSKQGKAVRAELEQAGVEMEEAADARRDAQQSLEALKRLSKPLAPDEQLPPSTLEETAREVGKSPLELRNEARRLMGLAPEKEPAPEAKPAPETTQPDQQILQRAQEGYDWYREKGLAPEVALERVRERNPALKDWVPEGHTQAKESPAEPPLSHDSVVPPTHPQEPARAAEKAPAPTERPASWQRVDRAYEKYLGTMKPEAARQAAEVLARSVKAEGWTPLAEEPARAAVPVPPEVKTAEKPAEAKAPEQTREQKIEARVKELIRNGLSERVARGQASQEFPNERLEVAGGESRADAQNVERVEPDEEVPGSKELSEALGKAGLTSYQQWILQGYHDGLTLEEIAQQRGVSKQAVSKAGLKALEKLEKQGGLTDSMRDLQATLREMSRPEKKGTVEAGELSATTEEAPVRGVRASKLNNLEKELDAILKRVAKQGGKWTDADRQGYERLSAQAAGEDTPPARPEPAEAGGNRPAPGAAAETAAPVSESPEGMGTAGGGTPEPPPPPGTPGAAGAATPGGGEPIPASSWFQKAGDWLKSFAQKTFPAVHRLSQSAGEKLAESANAANAARASWDYFSRILKVGGKALGDLTPEERQAVGAVWLERRMRHHREQLRRQGLDASRVGTLIGQEGSPLQTEADYQAGREALWSFWEAIKQEWTPEVEKNYKDVLGLEEADDIKSPSQIPGLPLNAIGLTEADPAQGVVGTGKSQGMGNLRVKKPGFTRAAGLDAAAYDLDIQHMMERTLNLGVPAGRRADFVRTALAEGVIRKVLPGEHVPEGWKELGLKPAQGLPELEAKASYYAHPDAYKDIIQGLGVGERPGQTLADGVRPVMDKLYGLALMSPVELATHIANHFTALFRSGMGVPLWNLKDSFANAWKVWKQEPEILRRVMELAKIGASTHHETRPGILGERFKAYDPTWYINRFTSTFIDVMQKGVRVQLEDAFDRMVKAGYLEGGTASKRDFINQALGNYNSQAGNRLAQFLKDTGLQSFATAAHTFTTQGAKVATGGAINAQATSNTAALQLRAQAMLKLLPLLAIGPVLNYLRYGQSFPADVPAFAVQTRDDQDGKVHFFDPLTFTGLRRGWRAVGINALIEAGRQGKTSGEIADRAVRDFLLTGEHLLAGPPAQFAHTLATGEDALGRHVANRVSTARTAQGQASAAQRGEAPPGSSKYWEHLKAALAGINPIVASLTEKNKAPRTVLEKLTQSAGPFGEKTRDLKKKK